MWSIKDLVDIAINRRNNKFDFNIAVSGLRGNGKSTLLFKFFSRFNEFNAWKHQVYSREDVIKLLESQKYGFIFDDEAITTAYKRQFYNKEQQKLIQMLNMYRDNFNIYGLCVPNFYSLDRDLRDLIKIHVHVISRGLGVVHISKSSSLYSDDNWNVAYNKKVEDNWDRIKIKKPTFKPMYQRLTTFKGYIRFGDLTKKQRKLYEEIKVKKRKEVYDRENTGEGTTKDIHELILDRIIKAYDEGSTKYNSDVLNEMCFINGLKPTVVRNKINLLLKDRGETITLNKLFGAKESPKNLSPSSNNHIKLIGIPNNSKKLIGIPNNSRKPSFVNKYPVHSKNLSEKFRLDDTPKES